MSGRRGGGAGTSVDFQKAGINCRCLRCGLVLSWNALARSGHRSGNRCEGIQAAKVFCRVIAFFASKVERHEKDPPIVLHDRWLGSQQKHDERAALDITQPHHINCPSCDGPITVGAKTCPTCGATCQ